MHLMDNVPKWLPWTSVLNLEIPECPNQPLWSSWCSSLQKPLTKRGDMTGPYKAKLWVVISTQPRDSMLALAGGHLGASFRDQVIVEKEGGQGEEGDKEEEHACVLTKQSPHQDRAGQNLRMQDMRSARAALSGPPWGTATSIHPNSTCGQMIYVGLKGEIRLPSHMASWCQTCGQNLGPDPTPFPSPPTAPPVS